MRRTLLAMGAVLALALASSASASSFEARNIPADAKWLMHFDVDSFRETKLAEHIRRERLDDPQVKRWFDWVEERYGINLCEDLHGMTFYGSSYEPHRGVVLLFGNYDREKTTAVIKDEPGYKTSEYGDYTLHTWSVKKDPKDQAQQQQDAQADATHKRYPSTMAAAFHERGVVIASSPDAVKHALDVIDGKEPALEDSSPLLGARPPGTVFYGAAIDLESLKEHGDGMPQFAILRQGEFVNVALGQHEGNAFYRVRFEARSPEVAQQIGKILEGFEAMLALQGENNETLASVAEGLKWKVDDATVSINWKAKSDDVVELAKERMRRMPHRHALRHKHSQQQQDAPQRR